MSTSERGGRSQFRREPLWKVCLICKTAVAVGQMAVQGGDPPCSASRMGETAVLAKRDGLHLRTAYRKDRRVKALHEKLLRAALQVGRLEGSALLAVLEGE